MNLDDRCNNDTPMVVRCLVLEDRHGRDVVVVIAKLTWSVSAAGEATLGPERPIRMGDERTGPGPWSSVRLPTDLCDEKPGTDVLLVGTAHPPPGSGATYVDVGLRVGSARRPIGKLVRVHGPRVWYESALGVAPGPAAPLAPTPLRYELAFGGVDESSPREPLVDWRNPSGTGIAHDRRALVGRPAPQLEDPAAPLGSRRPAPAGFGPIAPHWEPRAARAGTCDDDWRRERAPVRPADFDPRHHSAAPDDLWSPEPLEGDEPVEIVGATPEGAWRFALPRYFPRFAAEIRGARVDLDTHLDTLLIDADQRCVELVWRTSFLVPKRLALVDGIAVAGAAPLPRRVRAASAGR